MAAIRLQNGDHINFDRGTITRNGRTTTIRNYRKTGNRSFRNSRHHHTVVHHNSGGGVQRYISRVPINNPSAPREWKVNGRWTRTNPNNGGGSNNNNNNIQKPKPKNNLINEKLKLYNNEILKAKKGIKPDVVGLMRKGVINGDQATLIVNQYEKSPTFLKIMSKNDFSKFWKGVNTKNQATDINTQNNAFKISVNQLAKNHFNKFKINYIKPINYDSSVKDFNNLNKKLKNFNLLDHIAKQIPTIKKPKTNKFSLSNQNQELKVFNKFITKQTLTPNDKKILDKHFNKINDNQLKTLNYIHAPLDLLETGLSKVSGLSVKSKNLILDYGKKLNKKSSENTKPLINSISGTLALAPVALNTAALFIKGGINILNHPIDSVVGLSKIDSKYINNIGINLGKMIKNRDPQGLANLLVSIATLKGKVSATKVAAEIYKKSKFIGKTEKNKLDYLDKKTLETGKFPTAKSIKEQLNNLKKANNEIVSVAPNKFPKKVIVGNSRKSKLDLEDAGIYAASKGRGNIYFARIKGAIDGGYSFNPKKLLDTFKQEFNIPVILTMKTKGAVKPPKNVVSSKGFKRVENFNKKHVIGTGKVAITKRSIIGKERVKLLSKRDKGTTEEEFIIPKGENLKVTTTKKYIEVDGIKLLVQEGQVIKLKKTGLTYLLNKIQKRIKTIKKQSTKTNNKKSKSKTTKSKTSKSSSKGRKTKYKNPYSKLKSSSSSKLGKSSSRSGSSSSSKKSSSSSKSGKSSSGGSSSSSKSGGRTPPTKYNLDHSHFNNKILIFVGKYRQRKNKSKPAGKNNPVITKTIRFKTTKNRALKKVAEIVDNNLARSLNLRVIGVGKNQKDIKKPSLTKFRLKKSKNTPVLQIVEKSKYNFDTKGEKLELKKQKASKYTLKTKKSSKTKRKLTKIKKKK